MTARSANTSPAPGPHFTHDITRPHTKSITITQDDWKQTTGRFFDYVMPTSSGNKHTVRYNDTFEIERPYIDLGSARARPAKVGVVNPQTERAEAIETVGDLARFAGKQVRLNFLYNPHAEEWLVTIGLMIPTVQITSATQPTWADRLAGGSQGTRTPPKINTPPPRPISPKLHTGGRSRSAPPPRTRIADSPRINPFARTTVMQKRYARSAQDLRARYQAEQAAQNAATAGVRQAFSSLSVRALWAGRRLQD